MPKQKPSTNTKKFYVDIEMPPADDLIFCSMFENTSLFKRIIRAVVGKNEKVELKESPLSQVAYKNPRLSAEKKARLGSVRVDVQAEGLHKLFSLDMQLKYNETIILKRVIFYSFRMFTSQTVDKMRYDKLKPACVTFIMAESLDNDEKYEKLRLTVYNEITGEKYFDILDSYLVFVPNVIKNSKNKNDDLYVFSSFFAVTNQNQADEFERNYGAKPLGKELICLYTGAVADKIRLLDLRQYNYYFTEKEYERVKLEDDQKHAQEILKIEKQLLESEKQRRESEKQRRESEKQRRESEKRAKEQLLEAAVKLIINGMDIIVVSDIMNVSKSDIEEYITSKQKKNYDLCKEPSH